MFVTIAIFLLLFGLGLVLIVLPFNRLKELRRTIEALTKRIAALERKSQGSETPRTFEKPAIRPRRWSRRHGETRRRKSQRANRPSGR